ncbi:MAG: Bax inhibitor-1/YccA family protein [Actinomycetota bacterium]|nr:Bax inhibitor-1/YccA family protein [Actinomycetota bacterium]
MANPMLNEQSLDRAFGSLRGGSGPAVPGFTLPRQAPGRPVDDGPISRYQTELMTMEGTARRALMLFAIVVAAAVVGWSLVTTGELGVTSFPVWLIVPALAAFGLALVTAFKPAAARFTAPAYAVCQGLFVGALSHVYEASYSGIVVQALLGTAGVFSAMLFLYSQRIIKVTDRMRKMVLAATAGIAVIYLVGMVARLFGAEVSFLTDASGIGILFSLVVVGVAAFNLLLDFDLIERSVQRGAPRELEWFAAFGLMVTVVWLYLELLRLLSRFNRR